MENVGDELDVLDVPMRLLSCVGIPPILFGESAESRFAVCKMPFIPGVMADVLKLDARQFCFFKKIK